MLLLVTMFAVVCDYLLEDTLLVPLAYLLLLVKIAEGIPVSSSVVCQPGYFLNKSHIPQIHSSCVPCSSCAAGNGIHTLCHNATDTVCQPCSQGYYSQYSTSHNNRLCNICTNCSALNKVTTSGCTPLQDSICGKCVKDYFLTVNNNGYTECAQCSYCPPEQEVAKWYDCTHLPKNRQCAPGYALAGPSAALESPTVLVATSTPRDWDRLLAELSGHDRHGFVSIPGYDSSSGDHLSLAAYEIMASIVSILLTAVMLSLVLCTVSKYMRRMCCTRTNRSQAS